MNIYRLICKYIGHRWRRGMIVKTCKRCGVQVPIKKRVK